MINVRYNQVTADESGQRIDNYLLGQLKGVPKSHVYRIIRSGEVRVNKKRIKPPYRIQAGDVIRIPPVRVSEEKEVNWKGQQAGLRLLDCIIYEDERLLVINKPSGIAVHGGSGLSFGVIEALRHVRPEARYLELVHRIDRETSGCLLLAKKRSTLRALHRLFEAKQIEKIYTALLHGRWAHPNQWCVEEALQKNQLSSGERIVCVSAEGKPALTQLQLLDNYANACKIEARPLTGRTHQIRVHCAFAGHPIVGDDKYAGKASPDFIASIPSRLYLHAKEIRFTLDDITHHFKAPYDRKFNDAMQSLQSES